jgi:hypothetical protein
MESFSLMGGPLDAVGRRVGLVRDTNSVRLGLVLGVGLWLVILALCVIEGVTDRLFQLSVIGGSVRLLLAIPLFFICESWVGPRMTACVAAITATGIAPSEPLGVEVVRANRRANVWWPEAAWLLTAIVLEVTATPLAKYGTTDVYDPSRTALAASLYFRVGVTLFRFLLFRLTWKVVLWSWFLWRVSRLELKLIPGHPDHDGGLGPLEGVHERFTPFIAAISFLQCASLAETISTGKAASIAIAYPWMAMVLLVDVVLFICPLLVFTDKLWAARTVGAGQFGRFAARYVREFEAKWTDGACPDEASPLGTSDIQSLADLSNAFKDVKEMRWITVGPRLLTMIGLAAIVPFAPLLLFQYPIAELAQKFLSKLLGL